jgi:hypothetical protein
MPLPSEGSNRVGCAKPPIVAVSAISCAPIRWLFKQPVLLVRDDGRVDNCARLSLSGLLFLFGPRGGLSDLRSGPIGKIEIG